MRVEFLKNAPSRSEILTRVGIFKFRKHKPFSAFIPMAAANDLHLLQVQVEVSSIQTIRTSDYRCIHAQPEIWKMLPLGYRHRKDCYPDQVSS